MSTTPWGGGPTQFFYTLTPDVIDQVVIAHGLRPLGRVLALNSLENRVYDVEVSKVPDLPLGPFAPQSVVLKFYRPGRWDEATIREEHRFLLELAEYEFPVVAPLERDGETLFRHEASGLYYTVFPKVRGRLKDELNKEEARLIGRLVARLHNVGGMGQFKHRPVLDPGVWFQNNARIVSELPFVDDDMKRAFTHLTDQLAGMVGAWWKVLPAQRIHGDFHRGNVLWTPNDGAWITDLDDCVTGPRQQDLWLLFPGRDEWSRDMQKELLEGYHEMSRTPLTLPFNVVEGLRAMRMVHFSGWIGKRWEDPVFPHTFQDFKERRHWEQQVLDLKEQIGHLVEAGTGFE